MERSSFSISDQPLRKLNRKVRSENFLEIEPPVIMGILNVTPDSFSDGGSYSGVGEAIYRSLKMIEEGASIIDVGGESTRPFADSITLREEISRTIPVIQELVERVDVPISIDTRHAEVAKIAVENGATMINDVNGLRAEGMDELVVESGCSAVIMHMKGNPKDMQVAPSYEDVIDEIHNFLAERVDHMVSVGADKKRLMIDPGIGFGKRVGDNLMILRELERFQDIGCPILIGASRKSFIGHVLGVEVEDRLEGSISSAVIAAMNGASILRVHDVKETRRAIDIFRCVQAPENYP